MCPGVQLFIQSNKNRSYFARYREAQISENKLSSNFMLRICSKTSRDGCFIMYRDHSLNVTVTRKGAVKRALNEQLLLKARAH